MVVTFKNGQMIGEAEVIEFNIEPFKTKLRCKCGNLFIKSNSELNKRRNPSCGSCPRYWLLGKNFGKFTVTKFLPDVKHSSSKSKMWEVTCECGNICQRTANSLVKGESSHCGCSPKPKACKDITGSKRGKLLAISPYGAKSKNGDSIWNFLCDCGNTALVTIGNFNSGHTQSCGCLVSEGIRNRDNYHGMQYTPEYGSWSRMKERCNNPTSASFDTYGTKGITVCKEWEDNFLKFYEDMGKCPDGFSIDRIDLTKGYYKENCRWGSRYVQSRNKGSYIGTSVYKGVQYESSSGRWLATITVGSIRCKKIGRYKNEIDAAKAYNLASELIFGKGNNFLHLNDVDNDYSGVNTDCKFFNYWVDEMIREKDRLYEANK